MSGPILPLSGVAGTGKSSLALAWLRSPWPGGVAFGAAELDARAGFAVAIDDVFWPYAPDALQTELFQGLTITRVFLTAPLDTVLRRKRGRTSKASAPQLLEPVSCRLRGTLWAKLFGTAG